MVKLPAHVCRVVLCHLLRQGGDQVLDGAEIADVPAGRAGVGLDIAALAVMAVMAVQDFAASFPASRPVSTPRSGGSRPQAGSPPIHPDAE